MLDIIICVCETVICVLDEIEYINLTDISSQHNLYFHGGKANGHKEAKGGMRIEEEVQLWMRVCHWLRQAV